MLMSMGRSTQRNQIPRPIILTIMIDVMHLLVRLQAASIRLFPNQTMLQDISVFVRQMVARFVNANVSMGINETATLPFWRICSQSSGFVVCNVKPTVIRIRVTWESAWHEFRDRGAAPARTNGVWRNALRGITMPAMGKPGLLIVSWFVPRGRVSMMWQFGDFLTATTGA